MIGSKFGTSRALVLRPRHLTSYQGDPLKGDPSEPSAGPLKQGSYSEGLSPQGSP